MAYAYELRVVSSFPFSSVCYCIKSVIDGFEIIITNEGKEFESASFWEWIPARMCSDKGQFCYEREKSKRKLKLIITTDIGQRRRKMEKRHRS